MAAPIRCIIVIEAEADQKPRVTINWEPALPVGPHEVSWVELMAAAAVFGMSQAKSGKGREGTIRTLKQFDEARQSGGPDARR